MKKTNTKHSIVFLTTTAILMAMNIVLSSVSIPVPGGHLYLNDIVIVLGAILLGPFGAFMVGGVGAFLGDFFFYPQAMFVSLVVHGVQAVVLSLIVHKAPEKHKLSASIIGAIVGAIIMVVGYSIGRELFYNPGVMLVKLPYEILQAGTGVVVGLILCYPCKLRQIFNKFFKSSIKSAI